MTWKAVLAMSKEDWKEVTPNEQYREIIKRLVDEIEDNHTLACIYTVAKVRAELLKGGNSAL